MPATDPTFYRSPGAAVAAAPEQIAYVAAFDPTGQQNDALAVLDCEPNSSTYGGVVGWSELPTAGNELHHFGWNACSSALCHKGHADHLERRYLLVPALRSSTTYVLDTKPDPRHPVVTHTIEASELAAKAGYSRPHTVHCGPDGIFMSALGGINGAEGPGGVALIDHDTFEVIGPWELDRGPQFLAYDVWWHLKYEAWIVAGVAMGAVLYPPAFAALTRWYGPRHVGALTILTLVAGLSSTVFAPLTAAMADHLDWRTTYLVLAALLAAITIPAHLIGLRQPWPPAPGRHLAEPPTHTIRSRQFIALTVAIALATCASYAIIVNLVPLMAERGISVQVAAVALGLGGVGQVLGRLGYRALVRRVGVRTRTVVIIAGIAVTTALLGVFTSLAALVIVAVLAGFVRGIMTLLQATAVTDRWGPTHYGHLSGVLSAPATLATAISPWIGAALASLLRGYAPMFLVLGGIGALAAVISLASTPARLDGDNPTPRSATPKEDAQDG